MERTKCNCWINSKQCLCNYDDAVLEAVDVLSKGIPLKIIKSEFEISSDTLYLAQRIINIIENNYELDRNKKTTS